MLTAALLLSAATPTRSLSVSCDAEGCPRGQSQHCCGLKQLIDLERRMQEEGGADPTELRIAEQVSGDPTELRGAAEVRWLGDVDVHVARYREDTSWSDWLQKHGARVVVRPAEGIDEHISYAKRLLQARDEGESGRQVLVLLHGNAPSDWHSPGNLKDILNALNASKLEHELGGYGSLASGKDDLWVRLLKERWHLPEEHGFDQVAGYCCSQFAVHRSAVIAYPRSFYTSLLRRLSSKQAWDHTSYKTMGRTMDYIWHVMFTGKVVEPMYNASSFTSNLTL